MLSFLADNWATIVICAALAAVVGLIIARLIINKRKGKSSCGCGCDHCPSAGACHPHSHTDH